MSSSSSSSQNDQKAMTISKFAADGNWNDCIEESRLPIPKPSKSNKVIVKVHETALNPIDRKLVQGYVQMVFPRKFPFVVGFDFSGVVTAVGADVRHVKVGDAVFGCVNLVENFGAQAEYTEVDDFTVCKMPEGISFRDAATTTMTFITAHAVLYKVAKLKAGQQILVLGGAGATGVFAIQLAKFLGAKVVTTASAANTDYVKSLGADSVINYKETNWWKSDSLKESFDVIFDTAGEKDTWDRCLPLMKPRSHFVAITSPLIENQMTVSTMLSMVSNMAYFGVRNLFSSRRYDLYFSDCKIEEAMRLFNQLYTEGKIKTLRVDSVYPFSKEGAVQMLDKSKKGNPQGKLVMHIA